MAARLSGREGEVGIISYCDEERDGGEGEVKWLS